MLEIVYCPLLDVAKFAIKNEQQIFNQEHYSSLDLLHLIIKGKYKQTSDSNDVDHKDFILALFVIE